MDILDTRDLDGELQELEARREYGDSLLDADERLRLDALFALRDEIGTEWSFGVQLIPMQDFDDYVQQLAEDIGLIDEQPKWPQNCIDWQQAARELRLSGDYSLTKFEGVDYYYQA